MGEGYWLAHRVLGDVDQYLGSPLISTAAGWRTSSTVRAQAGAPATRRCPYWLHNGMLMIRSEEMHSRWGTLSPWTRQLQHWDAVIRFFILLSHYGPIDFTQEAVEAAGKGLQRLHGAVAAGRRHLAATPGGGDGAQEVPEPVATLLERAREQFEESMNDDFGTPGAIAALFDLTREVNTLLAGGEPLARGALEAIDTAYRRMAGRPSACCPTTWREADEGSPPGSSRR